MIINCFLESAPEIINFQNNFRIRQPTVKIIAAEGAIAFVSKVLDADGNDIVATLLETEKWQPDASFFRNKSNVQQEKWHCDDEICYGMPTHVWHGIQMKHGKSVRLTSDGQVAEESIVDDVDDDFDPSLPKNWLTYELGDESNLIMDPELAAADDQNNNIFNAEDAGFVQLDRRRNSVLGARSASDFGAFPRSFSSEGIAFAAVGKENMFAHSDIVGPGGFMNVKRFEDPNLRIIQKALGERGADPSNRLVADALFDLAQKPLHTLNPRSKQTVPGHRTSHRTTPSNSVTSMTHRGDECDSETGGTVCANPQCDVAIFNAEPKHTDTVDKMNVPWDIVKAWFVEKNGRIEIKQPQTKTSKLVSDEEILVADLFANFKDRFAVSVNSRSLFTIAKQKSEQVSGRKSRQEFDNTVFMMSDPVSPPPSSRSSRRHAANPQQPEENPGPLLPVMDIDGKRAILGISFQWAEDMSKQSDPFKKIIKPKNLLNIMRLASMAYAHAADSPVTVTFALGINLQDMKSAWDNDSQNVVVVNSILHGFQVKGAAPSIDNCNPQTSTSHGCPRSKVTSPPRAQMHPSKSMDFEIHPLDLVGGGVQGRGRAHTLAEQDLNLRLALWSTGKTTQVPHDAISHRMSRGDSDASDLSAVEPLQEAERLPGQVLEGARLSDGTYEDVGEVADQFSAQKDWPFSEVTISKEQERLLSSPVNVFPEGLQELKSQFGLSRTTHKAIKDVVRAWVTMNNWLHVDKQQPNKDTGGFHIERRRSRGASMDSQISFRTVEEAEVNRAAEADQDMWQLLRGMMMLDEWNTDKYGELANDLDRRRLVINLARHACASVHYLSLTPEQIQSMTSDDVDALLQNVAAATVNLLYQYHKNDDDDKVLRRARLEDGRSSSTDVSSAVFATALFDKVEMSKIVSYMPRAQKVVFVKYFDKWSEFANRVLQRVLQHDATLRDSIAHADRPLAIHEVEDVAAQQPKANSLRRSQSVRPPQGLSLQEEFLRHSPVSLDEPTTPVIEEVLSDQDEVEVPGVPANRRTASPAMTPEQPDTTIPTLVDPPPSPGHVVEQPPPGPVVDFVPPRQLSDPPAPVVSEPEVRQTSIPTITTEPPTSVLTPSLRPGPIVELQEPPISGPQSIVSVEEASVESVEEPVASTESVEVEESVEEPVVPVLPDTPVLPNPPAPTPLVHDVTPPLAVDPKPVWEGAEECTARNSCVKITRKNRFGENKTPLRVKLENDIRTDILNNHHPAVAPPGTRPKTVCDHKMGHQKKLVFEDSNIAGVNVLVERDQDLRGMVLVSKMDNSASRSTSSTEARDSEVFEVSADHLREPDDSPCLMPASVSPFHPDHQNLQQNVRHVPKTQVQSEIYDHLEEDGVFVATMQLVLNWPLTIPAYHYDPRNKQVAQFKWSDVMFRLMAGKRHFVRVITGKGHFLVGENNFKGNNFQFFFSN